MYSAPLFLLFFFWVMPGHTQKLLMTLHSEMTAGDQTQVHHMQSKFPSHCAIALPPLPFILT